MSGRARLTRTEASHRRLERVRRYRARMKALGRNPHLGGTMFFQSDGREELKERLALIKAIKDLLKADEPVSVALARERAEVLLRALEK